GFSCQPGREGVGKTGFIIASFQRGNLLLERIASGVGATPVVISVEQYADSFWSIGRGKVDGRHYRTIYRVKLWHRVESPVVESRGEVSKKCHEKMHWRDEC